MKTVRDDSQQRFGYLPTIEWEAASNAVGGGGAVAPGPRAGAKSGAERPQDPADGKAAGSDAAGGGLSGGGVGLRGLLGTGKLLAPGSSWMSSAQQHVQQQVSRYMN